MMDINTDIIAKLRIPRIFVAGAYTNPVWVEMMGNMRRGIKESVKLIKAGYAPYSPWIDFQFSLVDEIPLEDCYLYSLQWVSVCDAVYVIKENYETSLGAQREVKFAKELGKPVFFSFDELENWKKDFDAEKEKVIEFEETIMDQIAKSNEFKLSQEQNDILLENASLLDTREQGEWADDQF